MYVTTCFVPFMQKIESLIYFYEALHMVLFLEHHLTKFLDMGTWGHDLDQSSLPLFVS